MKPIYRVFMLLVIILYTSHVFGNTDIVYMVKLQNLQNFGGLYKIKKENNILDSSFIDLSENDRLPFFAKSKKSIMENGKGKIFNINGIEYTVIYDLNTLKKKDLKRLRVLRTKDKKLVIKVGDKYKYTLDKLPIVNFEIFTTLLNTNQNIDGSTFYLFEPQNKVILKVKLHKEGNTTIDSCNYDKYVLYMKTPNKEFPILNLYKKDKVEYIEANSKKWSLYLINYGSQKTYKENISDISRKLVDVEIKKLSLDKVDNLKLKDTLYDKNGIYHKYQYVENINLDENIVKNYIDTEGMPKYKAKIKNNYIKLIFSRKDICKIIKDSIENSSYSYMNYFLKENSSSSYSYGLLDESQEEESYEFEFSKDCSFIDIKFEIKGNSPPDEFAIKNRFESKYADISIEYIKEKEEKSSITERITGILKNNEDEGHYEEKIYEIKVRVKPNRKLFVDIIKNFFYEKDAIVNSDKNGNVMVFMDKNYFENRECLKIKNKVENILLQSEYFKGNPKNKVNNGVCIIENIGFYIPSDYIKKKAKHILSDKYPILKWYDENKIRFSNKYITFTIPKVFENCLIKNKGVGNEI